VTKDGGEVMERNDATTKTEIPISDSIFIDLFMAIN